MKSQSTNHNRQEGGIVSVTTLPSILLLMFVGTFTNAGCQAPDPGEEEWIQLFNGTDMNDWDVKLTGRDLNDNFADTYRIEDGILKVAYDGYEIFDRDFGVLVHRQPYSYYVLSVEYRFTGEQTPGAPDWALRNSGIMVHSQSASSMLKDQDLPISIEVQLLGGTGEGDRTTANLCTPGTHVVMQGELATDHCISSSSATFHGDQWVTVDVEVLGDSLITHVVNGTEVLSYSQPQIGGGAVAPVDSTIKIDGQLLRGGHIGLQAESHPIEFRKVELLNLEGCTDPSARNFKTYFVKSNPENCIYG
jgi:hypothetical protein